MWNIPSIVLVLTMILPQSHAYSSGPPTGACESMMPNHGSSAQSGTPPFSISVSKNVYTPYTSLTVSISGSTMRGFMLQARRAEGGDSTPVGFFSDLPATTKTLSCSDSRDTLVHNSRAGKNGITVTWNPPTESVGDLVFLATVVERRSTFWVKLQSEVVSDYRSFYADSKGNTFVLMFMDIEGSDVSPELYLTSSSTSTISVTVGTPVGNYERTLGVSRTRPGLDSLSSETRVRGSTLQNKGIVVVADEDIGLVGLNKEQFSADAFLVLPIDSLGMEYYAVTYDPGEYTSQLGIVAVESGTKVSLALPTGRDVTVEFDGVSYSAGDVITVEMDWLDALQIQSFDDLTGTHIYSSRPVAAFSGNRRVEIGGDAQTADHVVSQLIPVRSWGQTFTLVTFPDRTGGDPIRIVASEPDTQVTIYDELDGSVLFIEKAGEFGEFFVAEGLTIYIEANKPVQVAQFGQSHFAAGELGDATMLIIPSVDQYSSEYRFSTPDASGEAFAKNYAIVVVEEAVKDDLLLNGDAVSELADWVDVPYREPRLVAATVSLEDGTHYMAHDNPDVRFQVLLFGYTEEESYSMPAGMLIFEVILKDCVAFPQTNGDGIDNDCDGETDEEVCNGRDDDGDDYIDEDCNLSGEVSTGGVKSTIPTSIPTTASGNCTIDNRGKEFVFAFPESTGEFDTLELYIMTPTSNTVQVSIDAPLLELGEDQRLEVFPNQLTRVEMPTGVRARGTGVQNTGIFVSATDDIIIYGIDVDEGLCGGFQIMPNDALGFNYYAMSFSPGGSPSGGYSEITVTAAEDETEVTMQFKPGVSIDIDGDSYDENNPFVVMLDKYQTFQLQSDEYIDLTGTRVGGTSVISVMSGVRNLRTEADNEFNADYVVEQMIPLHSWGTRFAVVPFPDDDDGFIVHYVTRQPDTTVVINGQVYEEEDAGSFQSRGIPFEAGEFVGIESSQPIMVGQIVASQKSDRGGAPVLLLVPPTQQYKNDYRFAVADTSGDAYLMLAIEDGEESGLYMDGYRLDTQLEEEWVLIPGSSPSLIGTWLRLPLGRTHRVYHSGGVGFAASVYSHDETSCALAYMADMCLEDIRPLFTPTPDATAPSTASSSGTESPSTPRPEDCVIDNAGKEFYILFPDSGSDEVNLELYVALSTGGPVEVTVLAPGSSVELFESVELVPGESRKVSIPVGFMMMEEAREPKGILVSSSESIVVFVLESTSNSCGGYTAMPLDALGFNHFVVTHPVGTRSSDVNQIAVLATEDGTNVKFIFPEGRDIDVILGGDSVGDGDLELTLNKYEAVVVQAEGEDDLSGTKVEASEQVAVYAGSFDSSRNTLEQMPPLHSYGKEYAVVDFPGTDEPSLVKIFAPFPDTTVEVTDYDVFTSTEADNLREYTLQGDSISIRSSKPILVSQFGDLDEPTSLVIPAVEQYRSSYSFLVPESDESEYLVYLIMVIAEDENDRLIMDEGGYISSFGWEDVPGTNLVTKIVTVDAGHYNLRHEDSDVKFGASLFGLDSNVCTFAFPAGMCLEDIREPVDPAPSTTTTTTTTTINTESSSVASSSPTTETTSQTTVSPTSTTSTVSPTSTTSTPLSTMRSTTTTEAGTTVSTTRQPSAPVECTNSNRGKEFVLMFMENVAGAVELELFAATDESSVEVSIEAPLATELFSGYSGELFPGDVMSVTIPSSLRMTGSDKGNGGIYITASEDIVLYGLNKADASCAAFQVHPIGSLGYEHILVSWWPPSDRTQVGVVAAEDDTSVTLYLHPAHGNEVEFDGVLYIAGDTITTTLDKFQTLQLQDKAFSDLTGSVLSADKPVAVFSGNRYTAIPSEQDYPRDSIAEPVPPLTTLGTKFALLQTPGRLLGDIFVVVAAEEETTVRVSDGDSMYFGQRGDIRPMDPDAILTLIADKPILVAQFVQTEDAASFESSGDPAMTIVTPNEQFRSSYTFLVPESEDSASANYLSIVIDNEDKDGLVLDGDTLGSVDWERVPGFNLVTTSFDIESGMHILEHVDGYGFGAYVFGTRDEHQCAYAYPVGVCLDAIERTVSSTTKVTDGPTSTTQSTESTPRSSASTTQSTASTTQSTASTTQSSASSTQSTAGTTRSTERTTQSTSEATSTIETTTTSSTVSTTERVATGEGNLGSEFYLMFLNNEPNNEDVRLLITTPSDDQVTVVVSTPLFSDPYFEETVLVTKDHGALVELPGEIRATSSDISPKGILVSSTENIVVSTLNLGSCSSYLALPRGALGKEYYSVTWWAGGTTSEVGIVTGESNTVVYVELPPNVQINFDGRLYRNQATIEIELDAFEVAQLQSPSDLSGLHITSNNDIAVISGNNRVSVIGTALTDQIAMQLTPVNTWGTTFLLSAIPNGLDEHVLQVHAAEDNTVVSINGDFWTVLEKGSFEASVRDQKGPLLVESTQPVMVVQFSSSPEDNEELTAPAGILIPPTEQLMDTYFFSTPDLGSDAIHYLLLMVDEEDTPNVQLDGVSAEMEDDWVAVEGTSFYASYIRVGEGNHFVVIDGSSNNFAAYVYGVSPGECAYGFPAGMYVEDISTASATSTTVKTSTTISSSTTESSLLDDNVDNLGLEFYLMFLDNAPNEGSVELFITTPSDKRVIVVVSGALVPMETVEVTKGESITVTLPPDIRSSESTTLINSVLIRSTEVVAVNTLNSGSCSSYLALPRDSLGMEYYTVTWWPDGTQSALGIVAVEDDTEVLVTLPLKNGASVKYNGTSYDEGDTLKIMLDESEVAQLLSPDDFSGVHIIASKDVAVFSGNSDVYVFEDTKRDQLGMQLTPVSKWGTTFVLAPLPGGPGKYAIQLQAAEDDTTVVVYTESDELIFPMSEGGFNYKYISDEYIWIESNKPVLIVQFSRSPEDEEDDDEGAPSAILAQPVEHYREDYYFTIPDLGSDASHYLLVFIEEGFEEGLFIDDAFLEPENEWTSVVASSPTMVAAYVILEAGAHYLDHEDGGVTFGAYVYGTDPSKDCAYGFPSGMMFGDLQQSTTEPTTPTTARSTSDTSSAGTTPSASPAPGDRVRDNLGVEFILVFLDNSPNNGSVELLITSPSNDAVVVDITAPLLEEPYIDEQVTVEPGLRTVVDLPPDVRSSESTRLGNAILLQASDLIAVNTLNEAGFCSSYLALPTNAFGREYYVTNWWSQGSRSSLGIVAVADETTVNVTFPLNNGVRVTYAGIEFNEGDTLEIVLDRYEVAQLLTRSDFSGVHIAATDDIGVFSGLSNLYISPEVDPGIPTDQVAMQLTPVENWGKQFVMASLPGGYNQYSYQIQAAHDGTEVTLSDGTAHSLDAGDFAYGFWDRDLWIDSNEPVMVAQFAYSAKDEVHGGAPTAILIPPIEHLRSDYYFTTPSLDEGGTHYLVVFIEESLEDGLLLDDFQLETSNSWTYVEDSSPAMLGAFVSINEGVHVLRHEEEGVTFAAYVYGTQPEVCAYGFPAGAIFGDIEEGTTSSTESTTASTESTPSSTESTTSSTESTTSSTESTISSTESTTSPTESTTSSTESTTSPTESTISSTESTTSPTESTTSPTESTTSPTESTTSSTESTTSPTESTTSSTESTTSPTESTTSSTESTTVSTVRTTVSTKSTTQAPGGCQRGSIGRRFVVMFMQNAGGDVQLELFAASSSGSTVDITIEAPRASDVFPRYMDTVYPGEVIAVTLPSELRMNGTGRDNNAVLITSSDDIIVYGLDTSETSCGGFLVLPSHTLGLQYHVMAWYPPNTATQLGIAATEDDTEVEVYFYPFHGTRVTFGGDEYMAGDTLSLTMDAFETVQIQDLHTNDLSGTMVTSDKPIVVISGNQYTSMRTDLTMSPKDGIIEQMPPVDTWGKEFVLTATPQSEGANVYKIMAKEAKTIVRFNDRRKQRIGYAGETRPLKVEGNVKVTADKPILIAKFVPSAEFDPIGEPAMVVVTPIEQYGSEHSVVIPESPSGDSVNYLTLVVPEGEDGGILLNGDPIDSIEWETVESYITGSIEISEGLHTLSHESDAEFGAFIFGARNERECACAYPVGTCLDLSDSTTASAGPSTSETTSTTVTVESTTLSTSTTVTSTPTPSTTTTATTVRTGSTQTPPTLPPETCEFPNEGFSFVVMFMENVAGPVELELFAASARSVEIEVQAPLRNDVYSPQSFQLLPGDILAITLPSELRMNGSKLSDDGILITATERIVAYGLNQAKDSCGAFLILPIDSLAFNYYAATWWPPSTNTQIGVVATQDDTDVTITFHPRHGTEVLYDGVVYYEGDSLELNMDSYQTLQLQDRATSDLSGTKIGANKPVAAFSGNRYTSIPRELDNPLDGVVEQMPPLHAWGRNFVLVPTPDRLTNDVYVFVPRDGDTTIEISDGTSIVIKDRNTRTVVVNSMATAVSNKPVMVAKFVQSEPSDEFYLTGEPTMTVLTPTEQFRSGYTVLIPEAPQGQAENYLTLIVGDEATDAVQINGVVPEDMDWESVSDSGMVAASFRVDPGLYIISQAEGEKFGAYIFGVRESAQCAYSYSAGACLDDIRELTAMTTTTTASPPSSTSPQPGQSTTTRKPVDPEEFVCAEGVFDYFEDPYDCNGFYRCSDGERFWQTCSEGLHFSGPVNTCLEPEEAGCQINDQEFDAMGTEFVLMFLENPPNTGPVYLMITTPYSRTVQVNVTTPASFEPRVEETVYVKRGEGATVELPSNIRITGTELQPKGVRVTASDSIAVVSLNEGSCASYLALPAQNLGTDYYGMTWEPSTSGLSTIGILGTEDDTAISITLPDVPGLRVIFESRTYGGGDVIEHTFSAFGVARVIDKVDLTGIRIQSDKPIAVFAGNVGTTIGDGDLSDQTSSQMIPYETWGTSFVAHGIPGSLHGYYLKIMAGDRSASVTVHGVGSLDLGANEFDVVDVPSNDVVLIEADAKLMVIQYVKSKTDDDDDGAPAALLLPPVEQFQDDYFFSTPNIGSSSVHYIFLVVEESEVTKILLDGFPVEAATGWEPVGGSTPAMSARYVNVTEGTHRVRHSSSSSNFGLYVYGSATDNCAYAFPAGMNLFEIEQPDSTTSVSSGDVTTTADDVTTPPEPDTASPGTDDGLTTDEPDVDCENNTRGQEFVMMFMEQAVAMLDLDILPAVDSSASVTVRVSSPEWDNPPISQTMVITGGSMDSFMISNNLRHQGTEKSTKGVLITSSDDISLYALNREAGSCDGFLALPVNVLGTEYYAVTHFPPSIRTQVGVVAAYDDTSVSLTLPMDVGYNIEYDGDVYTEGMTIEVVLDKFETFQMQDLSDLTGVHIVSSLPVAVFSGNVETEVESSVENGDRSHLVEQMIPVHAWGRIYYSLPTPDRDTQDWLKIVASESGTVVQTTGLPDLFLEAGALAWGPVDIATNRMIVSNKPITVAQMSMSRLSDSGEEKDPTMTLLPPAEQFRSRYTFATPMIANETFINFIMVVISESALPRLMLDDEVVDSDGWTPFDGSDGMVGKAIVIDVGTHSLRQTNDVTFGAYVYGSSIDDCAYAYPAGMCVTPIEPETLQTTASYTDVTQTGSLSTVDVSSATTMTATTEPDSTAPPCQCTRLVVSSEDLQPLYAGIYYEQDDIVDGRPIFKQDPCPGYIYSVDGKWTISPLVNASIVHIRAVDDAEAPEEVTSWVTYNTDDGTWDSDGTVSVDCYCENNCSVIEFRGNDTKRSIAGQFILQNYHLNGRPVYKHETKELYFYYYKSTTCQYWMVGPELGGSVALVYVSSPGMAAKDIGGTWRLLLDGQWVLDFNFHLYCV